MGRLQTLHDVNMDCFLALNRNTEDACKLGPALTAQHSSAQPSSELWKGTFLADARTVANTAPYTTLHSSTGSASCLRNAGKAMAAPAEVPMRELNVVNGAAAPQQRPKVAPASVPYWRLLRCCSQHARGKESPV